MIGSQSIGLNFSFHVILRQNKMIGRKIRYNVLYGNNRGVMDNFIGDLWIFQSMPVKKELLDNSHYLRRLQF